MRIAERGMRNGVGRNTPAGKVDAMGIARLLDEQQPGKYV